jgi:hypothetical protein
MNTTVSGIPWIPEPSRHFNLLFTVEGSGIQGMPAIVSGLDFFWKVFGRSTLEGQQVLNLCVFIASKILKENFLKI